MAKVERGNALVLGFSLVLGLTLLGYLLSAAVDTFRQYERTVTVKGLSERDRNNSHIKKVRVVSTITYYLSD